MFRRDISGSPKYAVTQLSALNGIVNFLAKRGARNPRSLVSSGCLWKEGRYALDVPVKFATYGTFCNFLSAHLRYGKQHLEEMLNREMARKFTLPLALSLSYAAVGPRDLHWAAYTAQQEFFVANGGDISTAQVKEFWEQYSPET